MEGTTRKHRRFVDEPMGDKPVTDMPGIGVTLGVRLSQAGYHKAYNVLGQYLLLDRKDREFKEWMQNACNANSEQAADCFNCLNEWCNQFL